MAQNLETCSVDEELIKKLKKFRYRKEKNTAAISMKIDTDTRTILLEEEYEDTNLEELRGELPEHLPRYLALSYVWNHDNRVSYPLCFIFISPAGCKPELQMLYASSKSRIVKAGEFTKVYEIRSLEDLEEDWLEKKLNI